MNSLRLRIFLLLAAVTFLVWSAAATWVYVSTRAQFEEVLDRRLVEAARMVGSLVADARTSFERGAAAGAVSRTGYSRQLSCQIWSLDGRLLGRSGGAPDEPLALRSSGFSERTIGGEEWRVYSHVDPALGVRVLVGDNLAVRRGLVNDLITGLLVPALAGLVLLGLLIWTAVARGLAPLRDIARELEARDPGDFRPLRSGGRSQELQPVVRSIDALFTRLDRLRASERHFIASAAHELQTPLAGLRTHAQIALIAADPETRQKSLQRIEASVDRTSRLVHQLLDLAREEGSTDPAPAAWTPLADAVGLVREELAAALHKRQVRLACSPAAREAAIFMNENALALVLRNLIENANNHSPDHASIGIDLVREAEGVALVIEDEGPGIHESELERVKDRFVRGAREKGPGSGLGLSIVELILGQAGARLELANRPMRGLRACVIFPTDRVRIAGGIASDSPRDSFPGGKNI